jgi:hypothetical protein
MDHDQLKRQMIFRLTVFFLITIVIGFVLGDLNVHSQMKESQDVRNITTDQSRSN